ncbi:helix-turn-helix domain-containing protein [Rhizobium lentis]|uniref:helix-turn-helix domain-containing protein n=1 Tax=Rhizobium lentis TaxID=1138194 RepID=UPI001C8298F3|nr:helix-turn-helix domain-containing protein [Rhizobium lentis]MBX4999051.1 excisionase family DNA-binding protein [Rhizobium lentis]MBX5017962.1 excisionase family DNA-binding protein [Rhizobium lentis]MBX5029806.1 excisionase family DNA-binding protein [Rhizobium lentis]MBX5036477.1 excisionase family DNA-binding protein [Rhizobium lentis]
MLFLANLSFFSISPSAEVDGDVKDVLTTAKAAELLGVSTRTAQIWVESGQLPSWKTPGGHRRIPREAVLELIQNPIPERPVVRAHAIIFAGEGRENQWLEVGLPALGLLVDVAEDLETIRGWLTTIPPMLIIIESTDHDERGRLLATLERDARFASTTIVSAARRNAAQPVSLGDNRIRMKMADNVQAEAASLVEFLRTTGHSPTRPLAFPIPWSEEARLAAVDRSGLVGSEPELGFDRLVRLAAHATKAPIAMFTLITENEQWFKSRVGFEGVSTPRDWAFCNETLIANEFTVLEDLSKRESLAQNPTLSEPFGFRFYAGAPVRDPLGFVLGSICVIDVMPRTLSEAEREAMTTIADAASNLVRIKSLERQLDPTPRQE